MTYDSLKKRQTTKFEKTLVGMMIAGSTLFFHLTGALLYSSSNHTPLIKSYQELNNFATATLTFGLAIPITL